MKDLTAAARCCEDAECCASTSASDTTIRSRNRIRRRLPSSRRLEALLPVAAMLGAAGLWGPSFVATKAALEEIPPFTIAFLRFFVASCFLYPLWRISYRDAKLSASDRHGLLVGGLVGVTLYFVLANLGLNLTTAGDAAILMAGIPAICLLAESLWLRQSVPRGRSFGIVVSIIGVFMVIGQAPSLGGGSQTLGDLLILAATVCFAAYTLLSRKLNHLPKLTLVAHQATYGMLMLSPFALSEARHWELPSLPACLSILYLGIMCSAVTYLLYNYALKTLAASQVSTFLNLVPVIGVAAAVFLLGEQIGLIQIFGGVVILVGVGVATRT